MTPESFNAQLALRKLEAVDILLKQAKTGSDADRIRAASAILRIAFFPVASASSRCSAKPTPPQQPEGALSASSGDAPPAPDAADTPKPPPHAPHTPAELALGALPTRTAERSKAPASILTRAERSLVNSS